MARSVRTALAATAAVALGTTAAVVVPQMMAVAASSPAAGVIIRSTGSGSLIARGAAVSVPLKVSCPTDSSTYVYVVLAQRTGNKVTSGSSGRQVRCTGSLQRVTLSVNPDKTPFRTGPAALTFSLDSFTEQGEAHLDRTVEIQLTG